MTLAAALFVVLSAFPVSRWDVGEPTAQRAARLDALATEIARYPHEAIALVTLAASESALAGYVGRGECDNPPPGAPSCDRDKRLKVARARTYWQLHRLSCPGAWAAEQGSQSELREAAWCAARLWRLGYAGCLGLHAQGNLAGAFAGYRQLGYCTFTPVMDRVVRYRRVDTALERAWGCRVSVYAE